MASSEPGIYNDGTGNAPSITFSIIEGSGSGSFWTTDGTPGQNINDGGNGADPGTGVANSPFVDWKDPATYTPMPNSDGNYRLNGSNGLNVGSDTLYPLDADAVETLAGITLSAEAKAAINAALPYDRDGVGHPRKNGTIDMGAYED
jgi:hypothetical protein